MSEPVQSQAELCDPATLPLTGLRLIEASAGTGKTYTIAALALRLLVEQGISVESLLVVTFTKAATAELKTRIYARIQEALVRLEEDKPGDELLERLVTQWAQLPGLFKAKDRLRNALVNIDRAAVFTIHGWCQRLLQEQGFARGDLSALELAPDRREWLQSFVQDFWSRRLFDAPPAIADALYEEAKRCGPAVLELVGAQALRDPDAPFAVSLSWEQQSASYLRCWDAWRRMHEQLRMSWEQDPDAVRGYYESNHPKLSQTSYKTNVFQRRLDALTAWIRRERPGQVSEELLKSFDLFSDQGLRKKGRLKGKELLEPHAAAVALDPFYEASVELEALRRELGLALVGEFIQELRGAMDHEDLAPQGCTFDELLVRVRSLLRDPACRDEVIARTRQNYAAALIDEFQDTDPAQYEIVSTFWGQGHGALFLVGDPKQAIYRFRGADIHAYLQARADAKGHRVRLDRNFRSHQGVVQAVNALFSGLPRPFSLEGLGFDPVGVGKVVDQVEGIDLSPLVFWRGEAEDPEPSEWELDALVQRVQDYLKHGRWAKGARAVKAGDMAVLCVSNLQARSVRDRFERLGIPTVLRAGQSVWQSSQGRALAILLRAVVSPGQREAVRAALLTEVFGYRLSEIEALHSDDDGWEEIMSNFFEWRRIWKERGFVAMWRRLSAQTQLAPNLVRQPQGLRALTNWEHLAKLVYLLERDARCGPETLLRLVAQARLSQEGPAELEELRAADERSSVQILTIHKSKGLEFPIVFCPYLWKGKRATPPASWIQSSQGQRALVLAAQGDADLAASFALEQASESRRLLYVALTRAKSHCEIFWPYQKKAYSGALAGLLAEHAPDAKDPVAGMQALAEAHPESIGSAFLPLKTVDAQAQPSATQGLDPALDLGPAPADPESWIRSFGPRVSSYSGLARRMESASATDKAMDANLVAEEAPGLDEDSAVTTEPVVEAQEDQGLRFAVLEPGAAAGVFVHELFQVALERGVSPKDRADILHEHIAKHPQYAEHPELAQEVQALLDLDLLLGGHRLALGELAESARGVEVEFLFRCGAFGGSPALGGQSAPIAFSSRAFGEILSRHSKDARLVDYGRHLVHRGFGQLHGFINGFIDLVFQHQDRYFVADYKSNILDGRAQDFEAEALWSYAREKEYLLQALIYGVALHRRLRQRIPNYLPEESLGAAYLLFVRGMDAQGRGVLEVPLEPEVVMALDEAMDQGFWTEPSSPEVAR